MKEIEVKILDIDVLETSSKLNVLGAKKVFEGDVVSVFFDSKLDDTLLRLRKKGENAFVTVKKKVESANFKIAEEFESQVGDFEEMRRVLLGLGFSEVSKDYKKRISYKLGGCTIEIDTLDDIPSFLEIEAESEENVKKMVKLLGYSMKDAKAWNGRKVKEYYKKKN